MGRWLRKVKKNEMLNLESKQKYSKVFFLNVPLTPLVQQLYCYHITCGCGTTLSSQTRLNMSSFSFAVEFAFDAQHIPRQNVAHSFEVRYTCFEESQVFRSGNMVIITRTAAPFHSLDVKI